MQAPFICDYQTAIASYILTIQATTNINFQPLIRQSTYTGWNRSIVEVITAGLQINYNYTLIVTIMEENFEVNFCKLVMHNYKTAQ